MLTYKEVLQEIEGQQNHLLIGNGFNRGLGINTGYQAIFEKMIENGNGVYKDAKRLVEKADWDLERFIGMLEDDISINNPFLKKYINNKVKLDFMSATHEIVKSEIKNIYVDKNAGVFLLLQNFTTYFTLNYDSLLYLLLLKFEHPDSNRSTAIGLQPSLKFIESDLNQNHEKIYLEIKQARENGELDISIGNDTRSFKKGLNKLTKTLFSQTVKQYFRDMGKNWRGKDVDRVINIILKEEKENAVLKNINDGSQISLFDNSEFIFNVNSDDQNLFFLHGAFHIYKDGDKFKKITQKTDKALYERLESILNTEDKEVVCVFQKENKLDAIEENDYLKNCFRKLGELQGDNLVILGSSLDENDDHVFAQIEKSDIKNLYISTMSKASGKIFKRARDKFPEKSIFLFDATSISYELPRNQLMKFS